MTTLDRHDWALQIGGHTLSIITGSVTLDAGRAPFVQATVLCKYPGTTTPFDPRQNVRAQLTMTQVFGTSEPVSALSADWAGYTLSDVATLYLTDLVATISGDYGVPWNAQTRAPTQKRLDLMVRALDVDHVDQTMRLDLASDEAALIDYKRFSTTTDVATDPTVRQFVGGVLRELGLVLLDGPADAPVGDAARPWEPGVDAWDFIEPVVSQAGLRLWCAGDRVFRLTAEDEPPTNSLSLSGTGTVKKARTQISMKSDLYADAVLVTYRWRDANGDEHVRYDSASETSTPTKVLHIERETPYPGPGAAKYILRRRRGYGNVIPIDAISNYNVTPGDAFTLTLRSGYTEAGQVAAVDYDLESATMRVQSKGLITITPYAWAAAPDLSWEEVSAGVTWDGWDAYIDSLNPEDDS